MAQAVDRSADGGEALIWMGELTVLKVAGAESGGRVMVAEIFVTPEGMVPLHVHHREDETYYILEGELTFYVGDETFPAAAGSTIFCPKDVPHRYEVHSPTARQLLVCTPAGFEGFIRATSEPARSLVPPKPGDYGVDFEKVMAAAAEHGAEILG